MQHRVEKEKQRSGKQQPSKNDLKRGRQQGLCPDTCAEWKGVANKLINITPTASKWRETLDNRGLYTALRDNGAAGYVRNLKLAEAVHISFFPNSTNSDGSDIIARLSSYADIAIRHEASASLAVTLANFQKFLVLCCCKVLDHFDWPKERVFDVVRTCLGSPGATEDHCRRTLRAIVYANSLVDALDVNGWDGRANQLLLLCKSSRLHLLSVLNS